MIPSLRQYDFLEIKIIFIISCICIIALLFTNPQDSFFSQIWRNYFFFDKKNIENRLGVFVKKSIIPLIISLAVFSLSLSVLTNKIDLNFLILKNTLLTNFFICLAVFTLFLAVKIFFTYFLSIIFDKRKEALNYIKTNTLISICISLIILPFLTLFPFLSLYIENYSLIFTYFLISLFIISFILKIISFVKINLKKKFLTYRIFLYFCIIEIIPY